MLEKPHPLYLLLIRWVIMDFDEIKDNNEISEEVSPDVESTDVESTDEEIASDNKMKFFSLVKVLFFSIK